MLITKEQIKIIKDYLNNPQTPKVILIQNDEPKDIKQLLVTNLVNEIKKENKK